MPPLAADPIPQNVRRTARFYNFHLVVNASAAYEGSVTVRNVVNLGTREFDVAISLPRQSVNDPDHPDDGLDVLLPTLTPAILRNPLQTLIVVQNHLGRPPNVGVMARPNNQLFIQLQDRSFLQSFLNFFHDCRYRVLVELLRAEYLGRDVQDSSAVTAQLQATRQNFYNPTSHSFVRLSVDEYYIKFTNLVSMYAVTEMYPVDIAQLFWTGLAQELRDQAGTSNPPYVPAPRPIGMPETNESADRCLREVKNHAQVFERQVSLVQSQVQRAGRSSTRGSTPNTGASAFVTVPIAQATLDPALFDSGIQFEAVVHSVDEPPIAADPILAASVHLSMVEEALRKATGAAYPPLECWGCTNHKTFHTERFHSWRDCPHRGNSQVQQNAKKGLQAFIEKRNKDRLDGVDPSQSKRRWSDPYGPQHSDDTKQPQVKFQSTSASVFTRLHEAVDHDWERQGHPSQRVAHLVTTIVDPSTNNIAGKACYQALLAPRRAKQTVTPSSPPSPSGASTTLALPILPCGPESVTTSVMNALQRSLHVQLHISQIMPHIRLPIGAKASAGANLLTMVDSCAGLNLGRLKYHNKYL